MCSILSHVLYVSSVFLAVAIYLISFEIAHEVLKTQLHVNIEMKSNISMGTRRRISL